MASGPESSVLQKLEAVREDLDTMLSLFTRLVQSARIGHEGDDARSRAGGTELSDVFVEALVAKGGAALKRVAALNEALTLGNHGNQLYHKVKATQRALDSAVAKHAPLFALAGADSPAVELHDLVAQLEKHYYSSLVPPDAAQGGVQLEGDVEELCLQALTSGLQSEAQP